jgi:hypothetical protein
MGDEKMGKQLTDREIGYLYAGSRPGAKSVRIEDRAMARKLIRDGLIETLGCDQTTMRPCNEWFRVTPAGRFAAESAA